jgi:hypothetical protein
MKKYPISMLPNQEGFKFLAIYKDGLVKENVVIKDKNGLHHISDYKLIESWTHLN